VNSGGRIRFAVTNPWTFEQDVFSEILHVEQVSDEDLCTGVPKALGAPVLPPHEGAHRETVLQKLGHRYRACDYGFAKTSVRMITAGRYFYLLNHIVVSGEFRIRRVAELDAIRARIDRALEGVHQRPVVDTVFTEAERWMG
jgi:hypothetical protein